MPAPARVLVIDPKPHDRAALEPLLARDVQEVMLADGGPQALELIDRRPPRAVLLDLTLPRAAVFAVLKRVRELAPPTPVIGMSHRDAGRPPDHEDIACHVYKPFHAAAVRAAVRRALGLSARPAPEPAPQRAHRRCNVVLPAVVLSRDGRPLAEGKIRNLSVRGAQPHLDTRLEVGTRVFIGFRLPGNPAAITLPARVQWRNPATHGFAFGLQFEDVAPDVDRALKDVVESVR